MRLDKLLCEMGYGSRSEVKVLIKSGAVSVNGNRACRPEMSINIEKDSVRCGDEEVAYSQYEYYMFNKPAGCVTATEDNTCRTVMDYMTDIVREGFFPVGRLDKDTEGLLLITNDGGLAHRLLSPKRHVPKTYYARVQGAMTEDMIPLFAEGLDIGDDKLTLPAKLEISQTGQYNNEEQQGLPCDNIIGESCVSDIYITITEGRYHQVKRMVHAVGCDVIYLKRISMGGLMLDTSLKPGEYRKLSEAELRQLKA